MELNISPVLCMLMYNVWRGDYTDAYYYDGLAWKIISRPWKLSYYEGSLCVESCLTHQRYKYKISQGEWSELVSKYRW